MLDYGALSEKDLIFKCKKKNAEAFNELILRNRQKVYGYVLSLTKNEVDADDVFQQVLIKSWTKMEQFKGNSSFSTWACRIGYNAFADAYRKKQRQQAESLDLLLEDGSLVENNKLPVELHQGFSNLEVADVKKELDRVFHKLSEKHRETLKMFVFDDMNYKEIADEMNCSIGTVMSRLFYARKKAQRFLRREFRGDRDGVV